MGRQARHAADRRLLQAQIVGLPQLVRQIRRAGQRRFGAHQEFPIQPTVGAVYRWVTSDMQLYVQTGQSHLLRLISAMI